MTGVSVLNDKLRPFSYYEQKLPLYLRNSFGFVEHFRIWYQLLVGEELFASNAQVVSDSLRVSGGSSIIKTIDKLFELLNIFDLNCVQAHNQSYDSNEHYLSLLNETPDSDEGKAADILDKIGSLFGLRRQFSLVVDGTEYMLNLNNRDFLIFIKCTVIKNYFDGTYGELSAFYKSVGLPIFILTDTISAQCNMQLINLEDSVYSPSEDVKRLFLAGMLTVESAGIQYTYIIHGVQDLAIFDSLQSKNAFDMGVFVI